jgi:hypothetical protein
VRNRGEQGTAEALRFRLDLEQRLLACLAADALDKPEMMSPTSMRRMSAGIGHVNSKGARAARTASVRRLTTDAAIAAPRDW